MVLDDLDARKVVTGSPVDGDLPGYPVRVLGHGWRKYKYCCVHELARIGITRSKSLPAVYVQPTALGLNARS